MQRAGGFLILYHVILGAAGFALLRYLQPPVEGLALGAWAVLYNALLGFVAWMRSDQELFDLWTFLLPLSVFQVLPDVMLVQHLGTLAFPNLGGERWLGVPLYMGGLWVVPLIFVVWVTHLVHRVSGALALLACAAVSLALFGAAEWAAPQEHVWRPRGDVALWQGIALYVLPAEVLLGLATWQVWCVVQSRNLLVKVLGAAGVSIFYAGALFTSWFVVERIL